MGTKVSIYGQTYHLQGMEDGAYAGELAGLVDETMNLIATQVPSPDSFRVAVLTALHLADQLLATRRRLETLESEVAAKSEHIVELLEGIEEETAAFHAAR